LVGDVVAVSLFGDSPRPAALVMIRARARTSSARCLGSSRSRGVAGCGGVRKFKNSCTGALRTEWLLVAGARVGRASQQTVDHGAQLHQVGNRPQRAGRVRHGDKNIPRTRNMFAGDEIGPIGRNQNRIGVWRGQKKMGATVLTSATQYSQNLPFQRMAGANDRYFLWQLVVGSLSGDRSTVSTGRCCSTRSASMPTAPGCCSTSSAG
jgi:hypothetical protein